MCHETIRLVSQHQPLGLRVAMAQVWLRASALVGGGYRRCGASPVLGGIGSRAIVERVVLPKIVRQQHGLRWTSRAAAPAAWLRTAVKDSFGSGGGFRGGFGIGSDGAHPYRSRPAIAQPRRCSGRLSYNELSTPISARGSGRLLGTSSSAAERPAVRRPGETAWYSINC